MPDKAAVDALVARIRSTNYSEDPNDLAEVAAVGLSSIARQNTFNRGLHDNTVVDVNGGTTLAVGDNSALQPSVSLQQPATLRMQQMGVVSTRQQGRAQSSIQTVPAKVLAIEGTGPDAILTVALSGNTVTTKANDANQLVPGDPNSRAYDSAASLAAQGETRRVTMAGLPFQTNNTGAGYILPEVGQTIMVTQADTSEKRTIWTNRNRRNFPRVVDYSKSSDVAMVNDLRIHEHAPHICIPTVIATKTFPPGGFGLVWNWDLTPYQGTGIGNPSTYWRIVQTGMDRLVGMEGYVYPWYGAGYIGGGGTLVGLPASLDFLPPGTSGPGGIGYLVSGCPVTGDPPTQILWPFVGDTLDGNPTPIF